MAIAINLHAQGTAFTYQGRLNVSGAPATGNYDLSFTLYDALTGGNVIGSVTNAATSVNAGLFNSLIDFGNVFSGTNYWLEIGARTNGNGTFNKLSPRQPVLATPNAQFANRSGSANSVPAANIVGVVPFAQLPTSILTNNSTGVVLNGSFNGGASGLTNLNATNLTGVVPTSSLPDPEANAFCISNSITDPAIQTDVTGFVRELKASGSFSLLVDGLLLHPRFNPTNKLSLFGNRETVSNLAFSTWGASFNGTNSIQLPLGSAVTSNTLVYVFRSPYTTVSSEEFVVGLVNSNTLSADWMWEAGDAGTYEIWERSGGSYPYGGSPNAPYANLIQPLWINGYSYGEGGPRVNQRKVFAISNDGKGNSQFWQDTVQGLIGYYTPTLVHNSPLTNSDPMNVLCVGQDYTNLSSNFGPWIGEISAVLVFKGVLTQTQINSVYRAVRWLEPDAIERLYVGDSLMAPDQPEINNYPQFIQNHRPNENCWRNNAQGGTTAFQYTNYPLTSISSLPYPSKVKEIDVYYGFGINDIYGNGSTAASILSYMTNSISAYQALGAKVYFVTIGHIWISAFSPYRYNAGSDAIGVAVNQYFYTNFPSGSTGLAGIIPKDQIVSQQLLDLANYFSTDGLHFYGQLGPIANQAIADYMLGRPSISGYSVADPNHPVWPYDTYGNVWLNASTSFTAAPNGVTTNIVVGGHTFYYSNGVLINVQ